MNEREKREWTKIFNFPSLNQSGEKMMGREEDFH